MKIKYCLCCNEPGEELAISQVTALFSLQSTDWVGAISRLPDDTLLIYHQYSYETAGIASMCEIFYQTEAGLRYAARRDFLEETLTDWRWLVRLNVYYLLCQITKQVPSPWGILSGVRPSKLVHRMLDKGSSPAAVIQLLTHKYALQPEKAQLVTGVALRQRPFLRNADRSKISIYIGIPFCPTRCLYCSFPAYTLPAKPEIQAFLAALFADMAAAKKSINRYGLSIENVYVGGGTPTSLAYYELDELLAQTSSLFAAQASEFTVEAGRPDSLDDDKIRLLAKYHVGRVSVNPQTMQQKTLKLIGRMHSVQDIICVFGKIRMCNIPVVNMDLIAGLPGETLADMRDTLNQVAALAPDNLTVHTLALKRGSRLSEHIAEYPATNGITTAAMLALAGETARAAGMQPYYLYRQKKMAGNLENIGYSLPGKESVYNIQVIEERQTIIGIGPAATSKLVASNGLTNFYQPKDISTYITTLNARLAKRDALLAEALSE